VFDDPAQFLADPRVVQIWTVQLKEGHTVPQVYDIDAKQVFQLQKLCLLYNRTGQTNGNGFNCMLIQNIAINKINNSFDLPSVIIQIQCKQRIEYGGPVADAIN
jgi:hypothetical protein